MVSGDAIIQAAATMVVGVAFLITLRQVLGLRTKSRHLEWFICALSFFTASAVMAAGSSLTAAIVLFVLGMLSVVLILGHFLQEARGMEERESKPDHSMSDMRKLVFVFTGPAVDAKGVRCENVMTGLTGLAKLTFGWQVLESHCVPLDTPVRVGGMVSS